MINKLSSKKIVLFFIIFLVVIFLTPMVFALENKPQALFINQVRGSECCGEGNFENLKVQVKAFEHYSIPAYFTLRYDVLKNRQYVDFLKKESKKYPQIIKLGIMMEITPQLARNAKAKYKETIDHWFEAQNAFTIGYSKKEAYRMVNLLFSVFKKNFGYFPQLTNGWIIDTKTANYIQRKYKIIAHEITREQWGTDSYTLYGGPTHYPYPASKNWIFIPDFKNKNPLLILRQTVSDPLYNYGDSTNSFTSQPNDYLSDRKRSFSYFKSLILQAINQNKTKGFVLLGLENSMEKKYQKEYLKQIAFVNEIKNKLSFPSLSQLKKYWSEEKITYYCGEDLIKKTNEQACWIVSPHYRVRLRKSNNYSYITDIRVYDEKIPDPYNYYQAKKSGYWITPFLFDASHSYNLEKSIFPKNESDYFIGKYALKTDSSAYFTFEKNKISIKADSLKDKIKNLDYLSKKIKKVDDKYRLQFFFDLEKFNQERKKNYPFYLPEPINRRIDNKKSLIFINNQTINFVAKDVYGWPVTINRRVFIQTKPIVDINKRSQNLANYSYTLKGNKTKVVKVIIGVDGKIIKSFWMIISPNSKIRLLQKFLDIFNTNVFS